MFFSHLLLLLLFPAVFSQDENPLACLESGACFQVIYKLRMASWLVITGLLWHHLLWTPVCLVPRNPICRTTNRKPEVSTAALMTNLVSLQFRFLAPEPHHHEEGVWDVSSESTIACPQKSSWYEGWELEGEEDCLFLNVYSPENHQQAPLPVMVWIHGGALLAGAGTYQEHGPQHLLDK